jgi:antitoxin VapB
MADTTTVFQSGNSQAVRLPKEFRFKSKTVEIFRRGDEVVLREKPRTLGDVLRSLPPVTPAMDAEIQAIFEAGRDRRMPAQRDWAALWGEPAAKAKPRRVPAAKAATPAKTTKAVKAAKAAKPSVVAAAGTKG